MVDYDTVDAYGLIKASPGDRIISGEKYVIEVNGNLVLRVAQGGFTAGELQEVFRWPVNVLELPSGSIVEVEFPGKDGTYTAVMIGEDLYNISDGEMLDTEYATVKKVYYRHG